MKVLHYMTSKRKPVREMVSSRWVVASLNEMRRRDLTGEEGDMYLNTGLGK